MQGKTILVFRDLSKTVIDMDTYFFGDSANYGGVVEWNPDFRKDGLDEWGAALLRSPVGRAFITIAAATGFMPHELADPTTSIYIAAQAADDVELYHIESDREKESRFLNREAPKHSHLARQILAHPEAEWWFAPMDMDKQIWVSEDHSPPTQQPGERSWIRASLRQDLWAFVTSTHIGDTASMLAAVDLQICDVGYGQGDGYIGPPFALWQMQPAPGSRVFEIDSSHAWHELCVKYPRTRTFPLAGYNILNLDTLDADSYLEPDWSKIVEDWDAVHLTFGGLLTSHQVAVKSQNGWTYQYGWDAEQAWWLRWAFTEHKRLHDHTPAFQFKDLLESHSIYRLMP